MERSPRQEPITDPLPIFDKSAPDPNTDFGDEAFDYNAMPQKRISMGGINEWIFSKMRPKSKHSAKTPLNVAKANPLPYSPMVPQSATLPDPDGPELVYAPPQGYEVQNGLLIQKKSLAEIVRDQIKFPVLKNTKSTINGAALVIFAVGAFILYSELPTRPELVVGMIIVSISANIIISNR